MNSWGARHWNRLDNIRSKRASPASQIRDDRPSPFIIEVGYWNSTSILPVSYQYPIVTYHSTIVESPQSHKFPRHDEALIKGGIIIGREICHHFLDKTSLAYSKCKWPR